MFRTTHMRGRAASLILCYTDAYPRNAYATFQLSDVTCPDCLAIIDCEKLRQEDRLALQEHERQKSIARARSIELRDAMYKSLARHYTSTYLSRSEEMSGLIHLRARNTNYGLCGTYYQSLMMGGSFGTNTLINLDCDNCFETVYREKRKQDKRLAEAEVESLASTKFLDMLKDALRQVLREDYQIEREEVKDVVMEAVREVMDDDFEDNDEMDASTKRVVKEAIREVKEEDDCRSPFHLDEDDIRDELGRTHFAQPGRSNMPVCGVFIRERGDTLMFLFHGLNGLSSITCIDCLAHINPQNVAWSLRLDIMQARLRLGLATSEEIFEVIKDKTL